VRFTSGAYSVDEGAGTATITATLSAVSGRTVTVDYATSDSTATAGSDYTATSGTLTFAAGTTVMTFDVPIADDALYEANETVTLTLSDPSNAVLGSLHSATLTILDDDEQSIAGLAATNDGPTELGQATTLTATVAAGSNVAYTWAFGDGDIGGGAVVSHVYPTAGVYTAVVIASNGVNVLTATTTVSVTGPTTYYVYLPLAVREYVPPPTLPLRVGDAILERPVAYQGEVFYTTSLWIPNELPPGGHFYFSSRPDAVAEVLVDDELVVLLEGAKVLSYDFSTGGLPEPAIVEVPRSTMEGLAGREVTIVYRDIYSGVVEASVMWLIWTP
jgi:hypothetical protein